MIEEAIRRAAEREDVNSLSYVGFAERFSTPVLSVSPLSFYLAPNEDKFSDVVKEIKKDFDGTVFFAGVIGGVDMCFNYISNLSPERAFLFDIAQNPIDYLGLRLALLREAKDIGNYYTDMICAKGEEKEMFWSAAGEEEAFKRLKEYEVSQKRVFDQGAEFMRMLGYSSSSDEEAEVFLSSTFRKSATKECLKYLRKMLRNREASGSWHLRDKYNALRDIAQEDSIRAFKADLYDGFGSTMGKLIDLYGIKNLVLYISNVLEIEAKKKWKGGVPRNIMEVLKPLDDKIDRLWLVGCDNSSTNRIIGKAGRDI